MTTPHPYVRGAVVATCNECDDQHALATRPLNGPNGQYLGASICPECGSVEYETHFDGERDHPRPRLREALNATDGVGETLTVRVLKATMDSGWDPTKSELANIDGLSSRTARRIRENLLDARDGFVLENDDGGT